MTKGDETLTKLGWRVRRGMAQEGGPALEWRCPTCWQEFKAAQGGEL
jgi:hypothetical protein